MALKANAVHGAVPARDRARGRLKALALDRDEATPRYLQLARKFGETIRAGHWLVGEALPPNACCAKASGFPG